MSCIAIGKSQQNSPCNHRFHKPAARFILSLLVIFTSFSAIAQKNTISLDPKKLTKEQEQKLVTAHEFYEEESYLLALPIYEELLEAHPEELFFKYKLGTCYLYKSDQHSKALELLESIHKEKEDAPDINYYLGRALFLNYRFDDALAQFNKYLEVKGVPEKRISETQRYIEHSHNAKLLMASPVKASITNIGSPINTQWAEYVPCISSDQSVMIFTYRGEESTGDLQSGIGYTEDVFISYKVNGRWIKPESISENINGYGHDAAIALSPDGKSLFIYKHSPSDKGDIFISYQDGESWSTPQPLRGDVNTANAWEGSISISSDGKTVYFSSERNGGFGGKDIYSAQLQSNGKWENVKNLGPSINTKYDDDAPFIHPDGTTLYFSSQGHNSMGGYDIFKVKDESGTWSAPANLGYPINTPDDDIYFVLAANGTTGYYATGKKGGAGQQDIYILNIPSSRSSLMLVKGTVLLDEKPVDATITALYPSGEVFATTKASPPSGSYLVNLPAGMEYKLVYKIEGQDSFVVPVNTTALDSFVENVIDRKFYTQAYIAGHDRINFRKSDTTASVYDPIAAKSVEGLVYKVQIAAYRKPQNFKYRHLKLGQVDKAKLEDEITRFTVGTLKTLDEAEALRKKAVAQGVTDAFITAVYKGKRVYLKDLVQQGLFPK